MKDKYEGAARLDDENANLEMRVAMVAAVPTPRDPRHRKHARSYNCKYNFDLRSESEKTTFVVIKSYL